MHTGHIQAKHTRPLIQPQAHTNAPDIRGAGVWRGGLSDLCRGGLAELAPPPPPPPPPRAVPFVLLPTVSGLVRATQLFGIAGDVATWVVRADRPRLRTPRMRTARAEAGSPPPHCAPSTFLQK